MHAKPLERRLESSAQPRALSEDDGNHEDAEGAAGEHQHAEALALECLCSIDAGGDRNTQTEVGEEGVATHGRDPGIETGGELLLQVRISAGQELQDGRVVAQAQGMIAQTVKTPVPPRVTDGGERQQQRRRRDEVGDIERAFEEQQRHCRPVPDRVGQGNSRS